LFAPAPPLCPTVPVPPEPAAPPVPAFPPAPPLAINVDVLKVVFPPEVPFDAPLAHVPPVPIEMGTAVPIPPSEAAVTLLTFRYSPPPPPPPTLPPAPAPPPPMSSIGLVLDQSLGTVQVVPLTIKTCVTADYLRRRRGGLKVRSLTAGNGTKF
jgi:hypothetical protein